MRRKPVVGREGKKVTYIVREIVATVGQDEDAQERLGNLVNIAGFAIDHNGSSGKTVHLVVPSNGSEIVLETEEQGRTVSFNIVRRTPDGNKKVIDSGYAPALTVHEGVGTPTRSFSGKGGDVEWWDIVCHEMAPVQTTSLEAPVSIVVMESIPRSTIASPSALLQPLLAQNHPRRVRSRRPLTTRQESPALVAPVTMTRAVSTLKRLGMTISRIDSTVEYLKAIVTDAGMRDHASLMKLVEVDPGEVKVLGEKLKRIAGETVEASDLILKLVVDVKQAE